LIRQQNFVHVTDRNDRVNNPASAGLDLNSQTESSKIYSAYII
jgi:hypothetical protein